MCLCVIYWIPCNVLTFSRRNGCVESDSLTGNELHSFVFATADLRRYRCFYKNILSSWNRSMVDGFSWEICTSHSLTTLTSCLEWRVQTQNYSPAECRGVSLKVRPNIDTLGNTSKHSLRLDQRDCHVPLNDGAELEEWKAERIISPEHLHPSQECTYLDPS